MSVEVRAFLRLLLRAVIALLAVLITIWIGPAAWLAFSPVYNSVFYCPYSAKAYKAFYVAAEDEQDGSKHNMDIYGLYCCCRSCIFNCAHKHKPAFAGRQQLSAPDNRNYRHAGKRCGLGIGIYK